MKICPECLERVDGDLDFCPEDGTELRTIHAREEDPMEGRVLDEKWVVESKIGGGGMGAVYRGHQLSVDRTVAIKVLRSDLSEDDEHVQRFFREANVASNVSDPRCVTIYDFGQTAEDHVLYLAMEHLEGQSLHDRREAGTFTLRETAEIGIQIASALESLHGLGIIHRDLKPENVFLVDEIGSDLFLKVLDFGLAKVAKSDATPVTASGQVFGTPEFMSPEQCMGSEVGPKSDLYSLGCLLYELVTGQTPFASNSSVEVLLAHVNRPPPPVDEGDALPSGYANLIMQMLEKEPEDRPESSVAVQERLEAVRDELSGGPQEGIPAPEVVDVSAHDSSGLRKTAPAEDSDVPLDEIAGDAARPTPTDLEAERGAGPRDDSEAENRGAVVVSLLVAGLVAVGIAGYAGGLFERGGAEQAQAKQSKEEAEPPSPEAVRSARDDAMSARTRATVRASAIAEAVGRAEAMGVRATFLAGATTFQTSRSGSEGLARGGGGSTTGGPAGGAESSGGGAPAESAKEASESVGESSGDSESSEEQGVVPFLTESSATRIFQSKTSAIESCVLKELAGKPSSSISIPVEVIISGEGEVQSAGVRDSSSVSSALDSCVEAVARGLEFPPTRNGKGMRLIHKYTYRPSGGE